MTYLPVRMVNPGDLVLVEAVLQRYRSGKGKGKPDWIEWRTSLELVALNILEFGNGEDFQPDTDPNVPSLPLGM